MTMKYRKLGKWGLKISELSIGTMYHGSFIKKDASHEILKTAFDQGINHIDCADRYGIYDSELPIEERRRSEIVLGEFLKDYDRQDLVISSKIWYQMNSKNVNSGGLHRKHLREGLANSLKYLQTDYLDIYYCHRLDKSTPLEETILTMSNFIDEGLINYWGTSFWPSNLVERTIWLAKSLGAHPPSVEQPPYHMNVRNIETPEGLLDVVKYHGLGLITFEALATGLFTEKYADFILNSDNSPPEGSRYNVVYKNELSDSARERYSEILPDLLNLAKEHELPLHHLALAWTLRLDEVTSSLIGSSKAEQVVDNCKALEVTISKELENEIEKILKNKPEKYF